MSSPFDLPQGLPASATDVLKHFVGRAREAFGDDLRSAVLFGSAAEGRLRPQSDVNLILVLRDFAPPNAESLSASLSLARAAVDLQVMFLAEAEIPAALECFAQKFADILRRRHVVFGPDPFSGMAVSREDEIRRTRQVLLNLAMRLRERYTLLAANPDQLLLAVTDAIGPLRTCAAAIFEIEGNPPASPKDAFASLIANLGIADWNYLPAHFSALREQTATSGPPAPIVIAHLLTLATTMRLRMESHL